jgi:hypothetical protein
MHLYKKMNLSQHPIDFVKIMLTARSKSTPLRIHEASSQRNVLSEKKPKRANPRICALRSFACETRKFLIQISIRKFVSQ